MVVPRRRPLWSWSRTEFLFMVKSFLLDVSISFISFICVCCLNVLFTQQTTEGNLYHVTWMLRKRRLTSFRRHHNTWKEHSEGDQSFLVIWYYRKALRLPLAKLNTTSNTSHYERHAMHCFNRKDQQKDPSTLVLALCSFIHTPVTQYCQPLRHSR